MLHMPALMKYDHYSMWAYLTNVFTLGELEEYYDPKMGEKTDHLSYNVTSCLETLNVGTGMYSVSFVEMVLAVYDWLGSKNDYDPSDPNIYMVTIDNGMQHFPDACKEVLNLEEGVLPSDGHISSILVGMKKGLNGQQGYSPPNLTLDAQAPSTVPPADAPDYEKGHASTKKTRVHMKHKVTEVRYEEKLFKGHGGMKVCVEDHSNKTPKR